MQVRNLSNVVRVKVDELSAWDGCECLKHCHDAEGELQLNGTSWRDEDENCTCSVSNALANYLYAFWVNNFRTDVLNVNAKSILVVVTTHCSQWQVKSVPSVSVRNSSVLQ